MHLSIDLPPPLGEELAIEAEREGVSVSDRAALLLHLMTALTRDGRKTPFRSAVRTYLERNTIDADRMAEICEGLVALCLGNQPASSESFGALLRAWRSPDAHRPTGGDAEIEVGRAESPPFDQSTRRDREAKVISLMGKYAYLGGGTEEFMREKQLEIEREDRR